MGLLYAVINEKKEGKVFLDDGSSQQVFDYGDRLEGRIGSLVEYVLENSTFVEDRKQWRKVKELFGADFYESVKDQKYFVLKSKIEISKGADFVGDRKIKWAAMTSYLGDGNSWRNPVYYDE